MIVRSGYFALQAKFWEERGYEFKCLSVEDCRQLEPGLAKAGATHGLVDNRGLVGGVLCGAGLDSSGDVLLYTNNITREGSQHSDDSVWWIKHQQHQQLQQQQHDCGCDCQFGGGMRDAMSLPHLASPQVFRHVAPQYYSQV